jgi:Stage II sporulation protein M
VSVPAQAARRARLAICCAAAGAAGALALVVHVAFAAQTRSVLGFTFPGVDPAPAAAWSIFATNARKMAGIFGLALVLQAPWLAGDRDPDDRPRWHPVLTTLCDCGVAGVLASTFLVTAAGVGAYGTLMVRALLPHGPIELLAFATAVTLYLDARRRVVSPRRAAVLTAASLFTLALAALTETYISL